MNLWKAQKKQQRNFTTLFSYEMLKESISDMLSEFSGMQISDTGLSECVYQNQVEYRKLISDSIRSCCSGNCGARETVKELIRSYLLKELKMNRQQMQQLLFESVTESLKVRIMFEVLLNRACAEEEQSFGCLWKRAGWGGTEAHVITGEMIRDYYERQNMILTFQDELMILSQLLFADTVGLGVIDSLTYQKGSIEEIQLGMNGCAEQSYNYKRELLYKREPILYNKDGIHILLQGQMIWLQFLSFESEEELKRVLRNLIKDARAGELSKKHPMIIVDTQDGRRVSVSRPPATDSWIGLIRKFDTVTGTTLEELYGKQPVLVDLLRRIIKTGRHIAITGEMASGKTTLFRACLRETSPDRNLRVIESESFELNVRNFMPERNTMTMRISGDTTAEEVLSFAKKTTGQIFAVGEISSALIAVLMMDLTKIATQVFFSSHHVSTERMITDFVNAKLRYGGYSEERLAELDVVSCLGFDIHLRNRFGKREIQYINEISVVKAEDREEKTYRIRTIYCYDEETECGKILEMPGEETLQRAKEEMSVKDYQDYLMFITGGITGERKIAAKI